MTTLGDRIRGLREREKMSRDQLATKLGISYWAVSKYETGERSPDQNSLRLISSIFRVSTDYLLGITDDPRPISRVIKDPSSGDQIRALLLADPHLTGDEKALLEEDLKNYYAFVKKKLMEKRDNK